MPGVAIGARNPRVCVGAGTPCFAGLAAVLFMALEARLAALGRIHFLKAANQPWLFSSGAHVLAAGAVAGFARLQMMDICFVRFDVRLVARRAQLVVVHQICFGNDGNGGANLGKFALAPLRRLYRTVW